MTATLTNELIAQKLYRYERVATALQSPEEFGPEAIEQYQRDGFIAIENVFTPDEVASFHAGLVHLIMDGNPEFKGLEYEKIAEGKTLNLEERERYIRKLMYFVDHDARLKSMAEHPKLVEIVKALAGADVRMIQDMALLKPPMVGREKPWHQDTAYFQIEPPTGVVGTWTALDAATPENGCMHMIPGSHLAGPKPHYHDRDCQLPDDVVEVDRDVMVPLKPGGVLFFSGLIHHGTPPNQSAQRRRAIQLHYARVDCVATGRDGHALLFKDGAGYAGCPAGRRIATRADF
jgi:phytanoyl-CoA hydroxylase